MTALRWILMPIAAVAAWYVAILTTALIHWIYWWFDYPCSFDMVTAGACHVVEFNWLAGYTHVMTCIGAVLAAIYAVIGCVRLAPSHKAPTALAVFVVGSLVACIMGRASEEYLPMVLAIVAGAVAAIFMYRKHAVAAVA